MSKKSSLTQNQRFGKLVATGEFITKRTSRSKRYYKCVCDCGNITYVQLDHLISGHIKSCGCLKHKSPTNFKDLTGRVFERLTVIKFDKSKNWRSFWLVKCICGTVKSVNGSDLVGGKIKSCGCLTKKRCSETGKARKLHGMEGTRFYKIWSGIKYRCTKIGNRDYPKYGGKLCERWYDFMNFFEDEYEDYEKQVLAFGEKNTTADRFPIYNGNYEKANFRWATYKEQALNRSTSSTTDNYKEHLHWKYKLQNMINQILSTPTQVESKVFERYVGCSLSQFKKHIESQFTEGMTWDNRGRNKLGALVWQLDHKDPIYTFDLSKEEDRKKCFHYTNLRPMWWNDNATRATVIH